MTNFIASATLDTRIKWSKWVITGVAILCSIWTIIGFIGNFDHFFIDEIIIPYHLYVSDISVIGFIVFGWLLYSNSLPKMKIAGIYMMTGAGFSFIFMTMLTVLPLLGQTGDLIATFMSTNSIVQIVRMVIANILEGMAIIVLLTIPAFNSKALTNILILWIVQFGIYIVYPVLYQFKAMSCGDVLVSISVISGLIVTLANCILVFCWWKAMTPESDNLTVDCDGEYALASPFNNRKAIGFIISLGLIYVFVILGCIIAKSVV